MNRFSVSLRKWSRQRVVTAVWLCGGLLALILAGLNVYRQASRAAASTAQMNGTYHVLLDLEAQMRTGIAELDETLLRLDTVTRAASESAALVDELWPEQAVTVDALDGPALRQALDSRERPSAGNVDGGPRVSIIPRVVWQTYPMRPVPAPALRLVDSWRSKNPGFKLIMHDDAEARSFLVAHYPPGRLAAPPGHPNVTLLSTYDAMPVGVMRTDLWRYAVLYAIGGIYADVDTSCEVPVDEWFPRSIGARCGAVIGIENERSFINWALASRPGHPLFRAVLEAAMVKSANGVDVSDASFVHTHTGAWLFTDAIAAAMGCGAGPAKPLAQRISSGSCPTPTGEPIHGDLCILPHSFFSENYVKHYFGSLAFSANGFPSWLDTVREIRKKFQLPA